MKSDREFLDGIYEKAAQYKRPQKQRKVPIQILSRIAACFIICILGISVFVLQRDSKPQELKVEPRSTMVEPNSQDIEPINTSEERIEKAQPFAARRTGNIAELIVTGNVTELYEQEGISYAKFKVNECFYGECDTSELNIILTLEEEEKKEKENGKSQNKEENTVSFKIEDKLLLLLSKMEDGTCFLPDGSASKYTYLSGEGESAVYESKDGSKITPSQLIPY